MDQQIVRETISTTWDRRILPSFAEFVRIPAVSAAVIPQDGWYVPRTPPWLATTLKEIGDRVFGVHARQAIRS